jgi:hypothetical protein
MRQAKMFAFVFFNWGQKKSPLMWQKFEPNLGIIEQNLHFKAITEHKGYTPRSPEKKNVRIE